MDKQVYLGLKKVFDQNLESVLITVTSVLGSTPRKPGTKMLVFADGTTVGTIGGGCGEAEGRREALNVMTAQVSKMYCLNMTADIAQEEGMVCGGIMELFMEYLGTQGSAENAKFNQNYLAALESHNNPVLVTILEATDNSWLGKKLMINNEEIVGDLGHKKLNDIAFDRGKAGVRKCQPFVISLDMDYNICESTTPNAVYRLLVEPPTTEVKLLILGAGHIAVPLATMAKMVGYEVTVVDDRPSFANTHRFSTADQVICADFKQALEKMDITPQTFVVIITRGHRYDKVCLKMVIEQPAAYVGMIGSRKRVKSLIAGLEEEGVPRVALEKLYSPIGLKIGAETPEEIAVSILSELIKVQRNPEHS